MLKIRWVVCLILLINWTSSWSEVTLDGSRGPVEASGGSDYQITEVLGTRAGSNLFHSFEQFNIGENETATFSGSPDIQNVISRVTGGSPSTIDGKIHSTIPNANLFLINPFGVMFGKNASLDVQGSFHASTADYLGFTDGSRFSAELNNTDQVLTSASPEAFGFLGNNPTSSITLSGAELRVPEGKSLSLIGGDITLEGGKLRASGGRIDIASVNSEGEVLRLDDDLQLNGFQQLATIDLTRKANVDASAHENAVVGAGGEILIPAVNGAGGAIFIRGGNLIVTNSVVRTHSRPGNRGKDIDIALPQGTLELRGGIVSAHANINVNADNILLTESARIETAPGKIFLESENLDVLDDSDILANRASDQTSGDDLNIISNNILLSNGGLNAVSANEKHSAEISIQAENIEMNHGLISTSARSSGLIGDIIINTTNLFLSNTSAISSSTNSESNSGNIIINPDIIADTIDVRSSKIATETTGVGMGGNVTVNAKNINLLGPNLSVLLSDKNVADVRRVPDPKPFDSDGNLAVIAIPASSEQFEKESIAAGINTSARGKGDAGDITIDTTNLDIRDGARINASTFGKSNAGNINIKSEYVHLIGGDINDNTGLFSRTDDEGDAGEIAIIVEDSLILDKATISVGTFNSESEDVSSFSTPTPTNNILSDAGDIIISSGNLLQLRDSQITTSADKGNGSGGNIFIGQQSGGNSSVLTPNLTVLDNSKIIAKAKVGSGGNIGITADLIIIPGSSVVDASSSEGEINGTVNINSPEINLSGSLVVLPEAYLSASDHLSAHCSARAANISSFVIKDRGGIPLGPDDAASSVFYGDDSYQELSEDRLSAASLDPIVLNYPRNINAGLVIAESGCGE